MFGVIYKKLFVLLGLALSFTLTPSFTGADPLDSKAFKIVALGDSLTAGYALGAQEGFVPRLQKALKEKGHEALIVDAGVSGDTTSGGLSRLDWATADNPQAIILELGANDALRGIDPALTRANLEAMIEKLKARGIEVLLAGMLAPPNMGADFAKRFNAIYPDLARKHDLLFYPFFLEGVAGNKTMTIEDGMHPNASGIDIMVKGILPKVEELIARAGKKTARKAKEAP